MDVAKLKIRINELIALADNVISTTRYSQFDGEIVNNELFQEFRSSALSFLDKTFGITHIFYKEFEKKVKDTYKSDTEEGRGILKAAKNEIDGDWIFTIKGLVSAEIFSDFLEMAEYLLKKGFKDAAAVMTGSVLEEHLRQLCHKQEIPVEVTKDEKMTPKKADLLNSELASSDLYNKLDQKSITTWLDLRNKAAHGLYDQYTKEQVDLMLQGVTNFISRIPV
ncbi:hypothetical protein [Flavobacterium panacagri]|uniref:hypothetical protein n=1 Tax=Flavobacterium panacagri TaxID=3034146 RepID=UPI0025A4D8BA|nr:hypothetical protein [Flavobacterium panacagri]